MIRRNLDFVNVRPFLAELRALRRHYQWAEGIYAEGDRLIRGSHKTIRHHLCPIAAVLEARGVRCANDHAEQTAIKHLRMTPQDAHLIANAADRFDCGQRNGMLSMRGELKRALGI